MSPVPKIGDLVRATTAFASGAASADGVGSYYHKAWREFCNANKNKTIGLVCDKRVVNDKYQIFIKWFDAVNSKPYWYWATWDGKEAFEVFNES